MQIQFVTLGIFAFLILLHVMLHWTCLAMSLCNAYARKITNPTMAFKRSPAWCAMNVLLNIVGALVAAASIDDSGSEVIPEQSRKQE